MMMEELQVQVMDVNENDYVNVLEVASDEVELEECVCGKCGVSYKRVKGSNQKKTVCKKCFYDSIRKTLPYTVENGIATFVTSKGDTFVVDAEDADRVAEYCWWVENNGYVRGWINGKSVSLHRFIMCSDSEDNKNNLVIDHINHDKLCNTKGNLRICSHQENCRNKDSKGYYELANGTYYVCIGVNGKDICLGCYDTEEQARAVRIIGGEKVYFGEFSPNVDLYEDAELLRLYDIAMASNKYLHQNQYRIDGDVVYVTASYKDVSKEFVIDLENYEKIKEFKWRITDNGQIKTDINREAQSLTRFLMGLPKGDRTKKVKFKDGDKFNFRRENLQVIECKTKTKKESNQ